MRNVICSDCWGEYPLTHEYFYKNRSRKTGFSHICKKCDRERTKKSYYKSGARKIKEYALYKDDDLLALGTIGEIAKELKILEQTVRTYMTPSYQKRTKRSRRMLVMLDD